VAGSVFGDLDLDLRDASMDEERAAVTVLAAFGNVDLYAPEGAVAPSMTAAASGTVRPANAGRPP
jgi:hypothetical protein